MGDQVYNRMYTKVVLKQYIDTPLLVNLNIYTEINIISYKFAYR
jgi:hypothetical protein